VSRSSLLAKTLRLSGFSARICQPGTKKEAREKNILTALSLD
jgi:hypothetical protein